MPRPSCAGGENRLFLDALEHEADREARIVRPAAGQRIAEHLCRHRRIRLDSLEVALHPDAHLVAEPEVHAAARLQVQAVVVRRARVGRGIREGNLSTLEGAGDAVRDGRPHIGDQELSGSTLPADQELAESLPLLPGPGAEAHAGIDVPDLHRSMSINLRQRAGTRDDLGWNRGTGVHAERRGDLAAAEVMAVRRVEGRTDLYDAAEYVVDTPGGRQQEPLGIGLGSAGIRDARAGVDTSNVEARGSAMEIQIADTGGRQRFILSRRRGSHRERYGGPNEDASHFPNAHNAPP